MNETIFHMRGSPGPTVIILGAIHGNERVGALVIEKLTSKITPEELRGELFLILGNPQAYEKNVRFIDSDLNRLFGKKISSSNYEERRALELAPYLEKADYLLDVHSTIKPSVPFVFTKDTPRHRELANLFETDYIVSADSGFAPDELFSSTDTFVDNHGGIGLTYESGWHKDVGVVDNVMHRAKLFLQAVGVISSHAVLPAKNDARNLIIYDHVIPETDHFSFCENVENFSFFKKGKTLAFDFRKAIIVPHDSYVIFPKEHIKKGAVACYLARQL